MTATSTVNRYLQATRRRFPVKKRTYLSAIQELIIGERVGVKRLRRERLVCTEKVEINHNDRIIADCN